MGDYRLHPNVIMGDDNELFLSGGAHHIEDFILGIKQPSLTSFENLDSNIKFRTKVSEDIGAKYIHVVCPDKQTAYAKKYPIKGANALGDLYKKNCKATFLYPVNELGCDETYYKTDSHWNPVGALIATKHVLNNFNINYNNENQRLALSKKREQSGDLGSKLSPLVKECVEYYEENLFKITLNNGCTGNDGLINICINPEAQEDLRLLIFGDSFMMHCLTYFSDIFKYVIFVRSRYFHPELAYSFRPTHIISSNVERYLSYVDDDQNASNIFLIPFTNELKLKASNDFYTVFSALTSFNKKELAGVLYARLQGLITNREFETVDRITNKMILQNDRAEYLYLLRSRNFMASGHLNEGLTLAIDLVEISRRSVTALEHLAHCYLQLKEFRLSVNLLDEAITKTKTRYSLYKWKSIALKKLGLFNEALECAKIAIDVSNSAPDLTQIVAELEILCTKKLM